METKKSLRIKFTDEGGNAKAISVSNPKDDVSANDAKNFGDFVTENSVIKGKSGFLKEYNGATLIKKTEEELV